MIDYFINYHDKLLKAMIEHLQIVGITLILSITVASLLTILIMNSERLSNLIIQLFGVIYSIPSLALFALLIPVLGIGKNTAIVVLVVYNQFLLLRNNIAGLNNVDAAVVEASVGMGMSNWQVFYKVKVPLALPVIMAGFHLSVISTIGIATIAATINAGGIGTILFDGMRTMNSDKIIWGTIIAGGITLLIDGILKIIEKILNKRMGIVNEL